MEYLKSQIATSSWGGVRKPPKVFTEQGVAMLSAVLNSRTAVLVSVAIMDAFVKMRHFMISNAEVVCRMNILEKRQIATDAKVDEILQRIDVAETPIQGVFYDGQLWDARALVLCVHQARRRRNRPHQEGGVLVISAVMVPHRASCKNPAPQGGVFCYNTHIPRGACATRGDSPENGQVAAIHIRGESPAEYSICCTTATLSFS